jgi:hypothetical protein
MKMLVNLQLTIEYLVDFVEEETQGSLEATFSV